MVLELATRLKENYMVLLPETIPFLAELMEGKSFWKAPCLCNMIRLGTGNWLTQLFLFWITRWMWGSGASGTEGHQWNGDNPGRTTTELLLITTRGQQSRIQMTSSLNVWLSTYDKRFPLSIKRSYWIEIVQFVFLNLCALAIKDENWRKII